MKTHLKSLPLSIILLMLSWAFMSLSHAQSINTVPFNITGSSDLISTSGLFSHAYLPSPATDNNSYIGGTSFTLPTTREAWGYTITGMTIGETYTATLYYMFDIVNSGLPVVPPRGANITVTGGTSVSPSVIPDLTTPDYRTWFTYPVTFTATAISGSLNIATTGSFDNAVWLFTDVINGTGGITVTTCAINDPGAISSTCVGNNNLEFTTTITASNTTSAYSVTSGGVSIATGATYGTPMTFTIPDAADGTNKTITITDDGNPACTRDVTITGISACFSCDSGANGPRFLGLTKSTWMAIGIVSATAAFGGLLFKKIVL